MSRDLYECDNCQRKTTAEPEVFTFHEKGRIIETLDGFQELPVDDKPIRLCAVCVKAAETVAGGGVLMTGDGREIR